jgi:hypothetical protein
VENAYFAGSKNDNGGYSNHGGSYNNNSMSAFPETQAMLDRYAAPVIADDYAMLTDDDAQLPF